MSAPLVVFWFCLVGLVYIYFGYPLLVLVLARGCKRSVQKATFTDHCSVVVACYNEEKHIQRKISNLLALYSADRIIEVIIASDGSVDNTVAIARQELDPRLHVIEFFARRGKPAVLNDIVPACKGSIVVLTDARQELAPNALQMLLSNFADASVAVVSGELVFHTTGQDSTTAHGVGIYWNYEKSIRKAESAFSSVPGATGACYAIRKDCFEKIPENTLLDDVAIPMQAILKTGRCVFEEEAIAFDKPAQNPQEEMVRKRRTIAGIAQLLVLYPGWLLPWRNPIWLQYVSHKIMRLVSPVMLIGLLIANVWLIHAGTFFIYSFVLQFVFYMIAILGWIMQKKRRRSRLLGIPLMFTVLNLTALLALYDYACGRFNVQWKRAGVD